MTSPTREEKFAAYFFDLTSRYFYVEKEHFRLNGFSKSSELGTLINTNNKT